MSGLGNLFILIVLSRSLPFQSPNPLRNSLAHLRQSAGLTPTGVQLGSSPNELRGVRLELFPESKIWTNNSTFRLHELDGFRCSQAFRCRDQVCTNNCRTTRYTLPTMDLFITLSIFIYRQSARRTYKHFIALILL
jgi:hypothetical protein